MTEQASIAIQAEDELDRIKSLLEAVYLAASGLDQDSGAMTTLIDLVQDEFNGARVTVQMATGYSAPETATGEPK